MAIIFIDKPHGNPITRTFTVAKTATSLGYERGKLRHEQRVQLDHAATLVAVEVERYLKTVPHEVSGHLNVITVTLPGEMWTQELEELISQIIASHLSTNEPVDIQRKYH